MSVSILKSFLYYIGIGLIAERSGLIKNEVFHPGLWVAHFSWALGVGSKCTVGTFVYSWSPGGGSMFPNII